MAVSKSTYYGFTRVREASPSIADWAVTDKNFDAISLVMKALEQHHHNGIAAFRYPGYNSGDPTNPTLPVLTEMSSGGILGPGVDVGVRLAYVGATGLETDSLRETTLTLSNAATRPLTPQLVTKTVGSPGLSGGTYVYVITKKKDEGETLISDVLPVDITYDSTYTVEISFDPISGYTDGTTALNIYRATGLASSFQLLTTITSTSQTTFTDTNTIPSGNSNIQPPSTNTFDAARKLHISWATLTHPSLATKLRVYVTQQTGIWPDNSLLAEVDLVTLPIPTFIEYLGNETLASGAPNDLSELPSSPPKIDLGTEATGGPILTADMDFVGHQAKNIVLHNTTSPTVIDGSVYYDTSTHNIRARINGAWVNWGTSTASAYSHPAQESGGHIAANIPYSGSVAVSLKTILDRLLNTSTANPKQVQAVQKVIGVTNNPTVAVATTTLLQEMSINAVTPTFDSQYAEAEFSALFSGNTLGMTVSWGIEYDGSLIEETIRSFKVATTNQTFPASTRLTTQLGTVAAGGKLFRVLWWVDTGTATAVTSRRSLVCKVLF